MNSRMMTTCLLTIFIISFSQSGWAQSVWYVTESGSGLMDGSSWMNATNELQEAIDSAMAGDQI